MGKDLNIQSCEVSSWTTPAKGLTGPRRLLRLSQNTCWSSQTGEPLVIRFHFLKYNLIKNVGVTCFLIHGPKGTGEWAPLLPLCLETLGDGIEIDLLLPLAWDHSPQSQCPGGVSLLGFQD